VVNPIHKKGHGSECSNYRGISILSLPGDMYATCLDKRSQEIIGMKLDDTQCGFHCDSSTTDLFHLLGNFLETYGVS